MTTTTPRQTVDAFPTGFRLKDVDAALSTVSEQARTTIYPLRIRDSGKGAIRTLLQDIVTAFPDLLITVKNVIDLGDVLVAEFKIEGTQAADFLGAINQEKHLDIDTAWRFAVEDDQIVAVDAY